MFRNLITLIEHNAAHIHVWHAATKDDAQTLIDAIPFTLGDFGYGFYTFTTPTEAKDQTEDEDVVVLEYRVVEDMNILDLREESEMLAWHRAGAVEHINNPKMWKLMIRHGIDGVQTEEGICFYNREVVTFMKVYSGVIDDPLEETDTNELDEFALGGLQRCTAVTVNALLKDFNLQPITLNDVPVDHPGVLRILDAHGLAYKPFPAEAGRTVQQFAAIHKLYDWYLLTPGHAMALIRGELFDAENKGPDGRRLEAVFQISRR